MIIQKSELCNKGNFTAEFMETEITRSNVHIEYISLIFPAKIVRFIYIHKTI